MVNINNSLIDLIGNTPLVMTSNYMKKYSIGGNVIAKIEAFNPLSSVKDRVALGMIEDAEKKGMLNPGDLIVEPTSGNTGIGLAFISGIKGYKLTLTMPETMSIERRKLLKMLGAEIVLTPGNEGMPGAISRALELVKKENAFYPGQFNNPANPEYHTKTTAKEIIEDTDGNIDFFVAGVGSGGTITGVGKGLKDYNENIKIIAVEPFNSAVISGEEKGPHGIQGIGAGFIPEVLDRNIIDEIVKVKDDDAIGTAKEIAKTDGLLVGISSGAALYAAYEIAKKPENKGKNIIVILPDTGERYISTALFEETNIQN